MFNTFVKRQEQLTDSYFVAIGLGATHDFEGGYESFFEPFYAELSVNRYSVEPLNDRLYWRISMYYTHAEAWVLRISGAVGFSF